MLGLWMRGVEPGNVSVVQIEVQPVGKRSSETVYSINATVGLLAMEYGGTASPSQPLYVRFMVSRENLTATVDIGAADTRPLTTAREHFSTRFAALPRIQKPLRARCQTQTLQFFGHGAAGFGTTRPTPVPPKNRRTRSFRRCAPQQS